MSNVIRVLTMVTAALVAGVTVEAKGVYVGQEETGTGDGSSCDNLMSLADHQQTAAFAATSKGPLAKAIAAAVAAPGDTVYLCGTISSRYTVPTSGTSIKPVYYSGKCASGGQGNLTGGLYMTGKSYVDIGNLAITRAGSAVFILISTNFHIHDCIITCNGGGAWDCGIEIQGGSAGQHSTGIYIHHNTVQAGSNLAQDGIYLYNGIQDFHVYRNIVQNFNHSNINMWDKTTEWNSGNGEVYENEIRSPARGYTHSVDIKGTAGMGFRNIKVYRNYIHDARANVQIAAENIEFFGNVIGRIGNCCKSTANGCPEVYGNCADKDWWGVGNGMTLESGWSSTSCKNVKIFNNLFFRTEETAIFLGKSEMANSGVRIYNNIIYDCAWKSTAGAGWVHHPLILNAFSDLEVKNNIIYSPGRTASIYYAGSSITVSGLNSKGAGFTGNKEVDPKLTDLPTGQFWPASGSPVIDAGINPGTANATALMTDSKWPDSLMTGNQGSYGSGWEIGPFIFGEPTKVLYFTEKDWRGADLSLTVNQRPMNSPLSVSYLLPADAATTVNAYDMHGKLVATLANGSQKAGMHTVTWERKGLSAGPYCLKVKAGNRSAIKNMILMSQ